MIHDKMPQLSAHSLMNICFFLSLLQLIVSSSHFLHPLCRNSERLALLQFKNSFTIHKNFTYPSGYPKTNKWDFQGSNCCSWDGVQCDGVTGHVIAVDLSSSALYGSIHSNSSLFHLVHLQKLNLANNNFNYSSIPGQLGNLSRLVYLDLSHSSLSGQIPSEISGLSKLSTLDLSYNYGLEMPAGLGTLIHNFTRLQRMRLSYVNLNSMVPSILANFSGLWYLELEFCELHGQFPKSILQLQNLQFLSLYGNPHLTGYLPEFHSSMPLKELVVAGTLFSGAIPASIGNLNSLEVFIVDSCNFSGTIPDSLGNLTKLSFFSVGNNSFVGKAPAFLSNNTQLKGLDIGNNGFSSGKIPSSFASLSHLQHLNLDYSSFLGHFPHWLTNLTQLMTLVLDGNTLQGQVPSSIQRLKNLVGFSVMYNQLSGILKLDTYLEIEHLTYLMLSGNRLSLLIENDTIQSNAPSFVQLGLGSCNLARFPEFLKGQDRLKFLDLSSNNIHGQIPEWVWEISIRTLEFINLSQNYLTSSFHELPTVLAHPNLLCLRIADNMLQGSIPIPPLSIIDYSVSNNSFSGEISPFFCILNSLQILDLSHNNLSGPIPRCLANSFTALEVLNLQGNKFDGSIPESWKSGNSLRMIHLGQNKLQGEVPRSLIKCTKLELMHLGSNQLRDKFPSWLGALPELKVLILSHNRFHGAMSNPGSINISNFPKLQVVDLSNNEFTGALSTIYFRTWSSMKDNKHVEHWTYMLEDGNWFAWSASPLIDRYPYSISLINKGVKLDYREIPQIFAAIDFSCNRFMGGIPESVGRLNGLQLLNLSNNLLDGQIPSSMANLKEIETLDLSHNQLVGQIPSQLVQLNFLEVFNVSYNQLSGPIPQGRQFDTFPNSSFEGNLGLCGGSLTKHCQDSGTPRSHSATDKQAAAEVIAWKGVVTGYGAGFLFSLLIAHRRFLATACSWVIITSGLRQQN